MDINRQDALALLQRQDINEIIKPAMKESVALQAFRKISMSAGTTSMPVLAALPTAGWVEESATESNGVKPTSKISWKNKELVAREIACIVPVHEDVLADSRFDLWAEVRPLVASEFARILDLAVLFGVNKPTAWSDNALVPGAIAANNKVTEGEGIDLADDINEAFAMVEGDDFDVNAVFTGRFLRSELRGLRDKNNQPIYLESLRSDGSAPSIYGQDLHYTGNSSWDKTKALALVGDRNAAVIGIRQDMQVKFLDQATVGGINLAERDMVALRFKLRVAFATAYTNSVRSIEGTPVADSTVYPFAIVAPKTD